MMRTARAPSSLFLSLVLAGAATFGAACSGDEPAPVAEPPPEETEPATGPYDGDGDLRESEREVAGLTLPLGLDEGQQRGQSHVFRAEPDVPPAKLVAYFGARVETDRVEERGEGAIWRAGRTAGGQTVDVSVLVGSTGRARVEVSPQPEASDEAPTPEQIRAAAEAAGRDRD